MSIILCGIANMMIQTATAPWCGHCKTFAPSYEVRFHRSFPRSRGKRTPPHEQLNAFFLTSMLLQNSIRKLHKRYTDWTRIARLRLPRLMETRNVPLRLVSGFAAFHNFFSWKGGVFTSMMDRAQPQSC